MRLNKDTGMKTEKKKKEPIEEEKTGPFAADKMGMAVVKI